MNLKNVIHYPDIQIKYSDFFETYKMTFIIAEYPDLNLEMKRFYIDFSWFHVHKDGTVRQDIELTFQNKKINILLIYY
jgi:hypothetical protein